MGSDDWYGLPFLIIWGVVATFVGIAFASSPDHIESMYRQRINRTSVTKRLGERLPPRDSVIKFYRVGGIVFTVLGIAGLVVGIVGTIGFATGILK